MSFYGFLGFPVNPVTDWFGCKFKFWWRSFEEVFGRFLESFWEVFGTCLRGFWDGFEWLFNSFREVV